MEEKRIVAVGPSEQPRGTGKAVLPGLTNTHTRLIGACNTAIAEDVLATGGVIESVCSDRHPHLLT